MMTLTTLKQIMAVLTYSKKNFKNGIPVKRSYTNAVHQVANENNVRYQTIGDACRRRLDLDELSEFIKLLEQFLNGNSNPLITLIKSKTSPDNHDYIDDFIEIAIDSIGFNIPDSISYSINISKKDNKMLKALSEIEEEEITDCLNGLISESIKIKFREVTDKMLQN